MTIVSPSPARHLRIALTLSVLALLLSADAASAQGRHARLSRDLAERLRAGDAREASVILTGTDAQVNTLAARHGLRITKRLVTGAVVDVPEAVQLARLMRRDGIDAAFARQMVGAQATRRQRLAIADDVIVNDGPVAHLHACVARLDARYRA